MSPKFKEILPYIGLSVIIVFSLVVIWYTMLKKYSCNEITGKCDENSKGTSLSSCKKTCKKVAIPVKYACDVSIGQCKKDSNGTYPSLIACSMDCAQKTIYRC
ncbi:MAG: hypothetical protein NTW73_02770, partial [Candidatus Parcubacteria bacterium]|nr:hypothetical protein [Candidatus Parcubacteria bacterium]